MRLAILAVGRLKTGAERELGGRYLDRAAKAGGRLGFAGLEVREIRESRAADPAARRAEEAAAIRAALAPGRLVCLDETGDDLGSAALAGWLRGEADAGTAGVSFVIGGADGLDVSLLAAADRRLAFGRQTWPHQLVRAMLAEQLYRAMTILAGHPYHRA